MALFLKSLCSRFVRRLYTEHLPKGASADVDMEDADEDGEPDLRDVDITDLDKPDMVVDDEEMEGEHGCLSTLEVGSMMVMWSSTPSCFGGGLFYVCVS